ncbi:MAG: ATP-binding protein [Pseudonocardiaceae bacterium]
MNPVKSLDVVPNNLPHLLTSFVGRAHELVELRQVTAQSRLVTLTGAGGCGKTRLALQVAAEVIDQYDDGGWWVELAAVSDPDRVASAVARVFGLREEDRPVIDTLAEQLAELEALLILDNCEHVLAACTDLVERLLRAAPGLRLMTTSREPIGACGELTWRVPSLDQESAVCLFVKRATQVWPEFTPGPVEIEIVSEICQRLEGIPLAIELAAARARIMHPARILAALDDRFRLLSGGDRPAKPRQQTMQASVAWSHDLLDDGERAFLRRLSIFTGGFTLEAADGCAQQIHSTPTVPWTCWLGWSTSRSSRSSRSPLSKIATCCWRRSGSTPTNAWWSRARPLGVIDSPFPFE